MRSLYAAVLLAMVVTLSLSLLAFVAISDRVERRYIYPVFEAMDELELESARQAWTEGGAAAKAVVTARHTIKTNILILPPSVSGITRR